MGFHGEVSGDCAGLGGKTGVPANRGLWFQLETG